MESVIDKLEELLDSYEDEGTFGGESKIVKELQAIVSVYYEQKARSEY